MSKVFLYAPNINKGGGFVLLKSIIDEWPRKTHLFAYLDFRIKDKIKIPENSTVNWVKPSIYHRLKAEYMIARDCLEGDTVLFKNSLPPIFKCKAKVVVFMQNSYLTINSLMGFAFHLKEPKALFFVIE